MNDVVFWIAAWGLFAMATSAVAGILASFKNRDYSFWMGWCFVVPPMVIALLLLPRHMGPRPRRMTLDEEDKNFY